MRQPNDSHLHHQPVQNPVPPVEGQKILPAVAGLAANVGGLARDAITSPITIGTAKNVGGLAKDGITSPITVGLARNAGGLVKDALTSLAEAALAASSGLRASREPSTANLPGST